MVNSVDDSQSTFRFDAAKGAYSFTPDGGTPLALIDATAMIEVNARELYLDEADSIEVGEWRNSNAGGQSLPVRCAFIDQAVSLELGFEVAPDGGSVSISAEIVNTGQSLAVVGDCHLVAVDRQRGGRISLGPHPENVRFFQFKTWDVLVKTLSSDDGRHSSDLICHLSIPENGRTLFLGFVTVGSVESGHRVVCGPDSEIATYRASCDFAGYQLEPAGRLRTETLQMRCAPEPFGPLEDWASGLNARYRPALNPQTPVSWCGGTWGRDSETTAHRVAGNARAIRERLAGFDVQNVWTSLGILEGMTPGRWLDFSPEQFPDGIEAMLSDLRKLGFTPGFWIAPFLVFEDAVDATAENADNFVTGPDGAIVERSIRWEFAANPKPGGRCDYHLLDGSKVGARRFIDRVLSAYRALGVRYYMVDFLSGWSTNPNSEPSTRLQAARGLLEQVRASAGGDAHLLSAVGSSPHFIGCFDAARINRDYGEGRALYPPYHAHYNATYILNDGHFGNFLSLLRNVAGNYFTHRRLYINDYNLLAVDKPLPRGWAEANASVFGLSGSPVMLGDDIRSIHPERLGLIKKCLPRTEEAAFPVDLFDRVYPEDYPRVLTLRVRKPWEDYTVVAVFNWDQTMWEGRLDLGRLGCDADRDHVVFDFWDEAYRGIFRGSFECQVAPRSCTVFRVAEARPHPWLLSTDMHLQQGNVEVADLSWDPEAMVLRGRCVRPVGETGNVFVRMPDLYRLVDPEGSWLLKEAADKTVIIRRELAFDTPEVEWSMTFGRFEYRESFT